MKCTLGRHAEDHDRLVSSKHNSAPYRRLLGASGAPFSAGDRYTAATRRQAAIRDFAKMRW